MLVDTSTREVAINALSRIKSQHKDEILGQIANRMQVPKRKKLRCGV